MGCASIKMEATYFQHSQYLSAKNQIGIRNYIVTDFSYIDYSQQRPAL